MIDTSPRLILKAPRASAPLSTFIPCLFYRCLFMIFGFPGSASGAGVSGAEANKRNHQINASALLPYPALSLCHFHPLPCLFSHSFSFQNVANMCRHRLHTKHQSLKSAVCGWALAFDKTTQASVFHPPRQPLSTPSAWELWRQINTWVDVWSARECEEWERL